jgi:hypothetical protein
MVEAVEVAKTGVDKVCECVVWKSASLLLATLFEATGETSGCMQCDYSV